MAEEKGPLGILPKGPIRKKLSGSRGPTVKTLVKLRDEGYGWVAVVVDREMNIENWWEARSEFEAKDKARKMRESLTSAKPEGAPYRTNIIHTMIVL